jgi:uncharacterized protein YbjT (DUF2867 family)
MTKEKQNILVAGANGTTGRIVINLLAKSETYRPIAMVRKQEQNEYFEKENVTTVLADLEEDLNHAVKNANKIIFAAGSKGTNVLGVDQEGAKRLTDAAKDAGVEKLVMLSAMGADNPSRNKDIQAYLEAKKNADDYLRASGLDYSIVRPGHLTDEEGSGKIQLKKRFENPGKISRADVAKTLVDVLEDGVMQNQFFEIIAGDTSIEKAVRTV